MEDTNMDIRMPQCQGTCHSQRYVNDDKTDEKSKGESAFDALGV